MNIIKMNNNIKSMYDVADVKTGFDYWFYKLFNLLLNLFEYENIPEGVTARDIEVNLIMTGHAGFIARKDGRLFVPSPSSLFGYDEYYNPTWLVFANPVILDTKQYEIGKDCEVIYNNSLKDNIFYTKSDGGLHTFICRFARQLADIESTINIYSVNSRLTSYPVSTDNSVTESLKMFFKNLASGRRGIITDDTIIEKFRNVDINRSSIRDGVNDWLIARDKVIEQFFREIGIQMYNPKKAQVTDDEVESNTQILLISKDDMLKSRIEGLDKVNDMFGSSITCRINPLFDVSNYVEKGVNDNEA